MNISNSKIIVVKFTKVKVTVALYQGVLYFVKGFIIISQISNFALLNT